MWGHQFPAPGLNPCPLQWKCGFLTTRQSGLTLLFFSLTKAHQIQSLHLTATFPAIHHTLISLFSALFLSVSPCTPSPSSFHHPLRNQRATVFSPVPLAAFRGCPCLELVVVSWGCHSKIPQMGPLKQETFDPGVSGGQKVLDQGVSKVGFYSEVSSALQEALSP